jgi:hypothetical protein
MIRPRIASLVLVIAASAATANAYFAKSPKPCFVVGTHAYRFSGSGDDANVTVRVNKTASHPNLRMQLVNDPARADFIMVDDGSGAAACRDVGVIKSIRLDAEAAKPDLTVALSRAAAPYKIYVHSAHYTPQDAAALFAVMQSDARNSEIAARD